MTIKVIETVIHQPPAHTPWPYRREPRAQRRIGQASSRCFPPGPQPDNVRIGAARRLNIHECTPTHRIERDLHRLPNAMQVGQCDGSEEIRKTNTAQPIAFLLRGVRFGEYSPLIHRKPAAQEPGEDYDAGKDAKHMMPTHPPAKW